MHSAALLCCWTWSSSATPQRLRAQPTDGARISAFIVPQRRAASEVTKALASQAPAPAHLRPRLLAPAALPLLPVVASQETSEATAPATPTLKPAPLLAHATEAPAAVDSKSTTPAPAPAPSKQPPEAQWVAASLPPEHGQCSASNTARLYPALLRERGLQGRVTLRVQVDEQGRATDIQLKQGSGLRLFDEAARLVAQACRFIPARRGEQTVASWVEYPVRFTLQQDLLQ
ncbi:energy transducer TonB [Roseateles sp. PN1]|uniref:energy transducer TonB n=1 Tax=Roseateles sp. PN1 TaxID=3137372 RepID=UPI003138DC88